MSHKKRNRISSDDTQKNIKQIEKKLDEYRKLASEQEGGSLEYQEKVKAIEEKLKLYKEKIADASEKQNIVLDNDTKPRDIMEILEEIESNAQNEFTRDEDYATFANRRENLDSKISAIDEDDEDYEPEMSDFQKSLEPEIKTRKIKKPRNYNDEIFSDEGAFHTNPDNTHIGDLDLDSIFKEEENKPVKKSYKKVFAIIILSVIAVIFLVLLYFSFTNAKDHQPVIERNDDEVKTGMPTITGDSKLEEMQKLYEENSDLAGWLTINGTKIDYPVMYTKGEDYYLYRDFYKHDYKPGTLFIDKYNTVEPRDTNLIIHGHNMNNGTMFHDLLRYKDASFYNSHKKFTYYTLTEKQEYEIVSVFLSKVYRENDTDFKYYKFYHATTPEEYNSYITNVKSLGLYETNVKACYGEDLITLSTCEDTNENGRLVVVAKKVTNDNISC